MAHEIEIVNGVASAAYFNKPAWHGLGQIVEDPNISTEDFRKLAGLAWEVGEAPVVVNGTALNDYKGIVRDSDKSVLAVVRDSYSVLHMADFWAINEAIHSQGFSYEAAASLRGGKRVFALHDATRVNIGDEAHDQYLLIYNSFDGSTSLRVKFTDIRVECSNLLTFALSKIGDKDIKVTHKGNMTEKVNMALEVIGAFKETQETYKKDVETLLQTSVDEAKVKELLEAVLTSPREGLTDLVFEIYQNSPTIKNTPAYGTAWGVVNAVTEWTDHRRYDFNKRGNTPEGRTNSLIFGSGSTQKTHAFNKVRQLVAA